MVIQGSPAFSEGLLCKQHSLNIRVHQQCVSIGTRGTWRNVLLPQMRRRTIGSDLFVAQHEPDLGGGTADDDHVFDGRHPRAGKPLRQRGLAPKDQLGDTM